MSSSSNNNILTIVGIENMECSVHLPEPSETYFEDADFKNIRLFSYFRKRFPFNSEHQIEQKVMEYKKWILC